MTVPLRDRLAKILAAARPTIDFPAWGPMERDRDHWREVADALLASEEWQARRAVVEAAGSYADWWRLCYEREDDLGPASAEDLVRLGYARGEMFAALARLDAVRGDTMTPPADLAALRTLVEAVAEYLRPAPGTVSTDYERWQRVVHAFPAAREALEWVEKQYHGGCPICEGPLLSDLDGNAYCPPCLIIEQTTHLAQAKADLDARIAAHRDARDENTRVRARLARLEGALRRVRAIVSPAIVGQHECDVIDAALARDGVRRGREEGR